MSVKHLDLLFKPNSLAIIGASRDPNSVSAILMRNLMSGKFLGPVLPVSGAQEAIFGVLSYVDVASLPLTPDMAIICSPAHEIPNRLVELADNGTHVAVIMDPGYALLEAKERAQMDEKIRKVLREKDIRVLGPGSLGMIVPASGVNASLSRVGAKEGRIAFVTQSDSLFESVLDWAKTNNVGFSHCISLGRQLDVDFSSVLDYLGSDPATKAILLYVENIQDARRFMSATRASARNKPILVIRPRRLPCDLRDAASDLTEMDQDQIYDAAFRRAGMVRVDDIDSLFEGARTLANYKPLRGNGLAIMTNGQSIGLLAADTLINGGGELAAINEETQLKLEEILGQERCSDNPVTLPYNATPDTYARVLSVLIRAADVGCVLILHVPFQGTSSLEIAQAVTQVAKTSRCLVLANWLGEETVRDTKDVFEEASIPVFDRPGKAIMAYLHMLRYKRTQKILMQTPDSLPADFCSGHGTRPSDHKSRPRRRPQPPDRGRIQAGPGRLRRARGRDQNLQIGHAGRGGGFRYRLSGRAENPLSADHPAFRHRRHRPRPDHPGSGLRSGGQHVGACPCAGTQRLHRGLHRPENGAQARGA